MISFKAQKQSIFNMFLFYVFFYFIPELQVVHSGRVLFITCQISSGEFFWICDSFWCFYSSLDICLRAAILIYRMSLFIPLSLWRYLIVSQHLCHADQCWEKLMIFLFFYTWIFWLNTCKTLFLMYENYNSMFCSLKILS